MLRMRKITIVCTEKQVETIATHCIKERIVFDLEPFVEPERDRVVLTHRYSGGEDVKGE